MGLFEYLKTWLIVKWAVKEQIPQIIQDTCTKFNLSKIVAKNETSHDFYNTLYIVNLDTNVTDEQLIVDFVEKFNSVLIEHNSKAIICAYIGLAPNGPVERYMSTGKSISVELCMFPYFKKYSHKKIAEMMTFMENGK